MGTLTLLPVDPLMQAAGLANLPPRYADQVCPYCGAEENLRLQLVDTTAKPSPHWAACICNACNRQITFVRKPVVAEDETPRKRRSQDQLKRLLRDADRDVTCCELCLVTEGEGGQHMVIHHVIEVQDGGDDTPENLRVYCVDCHTDAHTARSRVRRLRGQNIHTGAPRKEKRHAVTSAG